MLNFYLIQTRGLLQNPTAPAGLYTDDNLTRWINIARGQLAGEQRVIRVMGTLSTVIGQRAYNFSSINLGTPAVSGVQGAIHVRSIYYAVGQGQKKVTNRPWTWFNQYSLNNPVPVNGVPTSWAQFGQGSAPGPAGSGDEATVSGGSFYLDPPPDFTYQLNCDCVCYPIQLVDDTTLEAIPFLFTDAVPFFAAYFALLSSQTSARRGEAEAHFGFYQTFMQRARDSATPGPNAWQYEMAPDPVQANKLGLQKAGGRGE